MIEHKLEIDQLLSCGTKSEKEECINLSESIPHDVKLHMLDGN